MTRMAIEGTVGQGRSAAKPCGCRQENKMIVPSRLVYGSKTRDIEHVRERLETTFAIKMRVFRNDDQGVRYDSIGSESVPLMVLIPNYDADEDEEFVLLEDFKEYPVILKVQSWEKFPSFMDAIDAIPDFGAELLEHREEMEVDVD